MRRFICLLTLAFLSGLASASASSASTTGISNLGDESVGQVPVELKDIGITEHLGGQVSVKDLKFLDESGKPVVLGDYFGHGRPVLLTVVYFECPNLCSFVLNGLVTSIKNMDWTPGKQFDVVAISMDPREGPELAFRKKASYLASYEQNGEQNGKRLNTAAGWHFLTAVPALNGVAAQHVKPGEPPLNSQVLQLSHELGFNYRWAENQFAHSAAIYVLTPEGKISRYLYGIEFPEASVKLALLEASNGKIGSIVDRVILFCYHYDPQTKKYSPYVMHLMQAGGGLTVFSLGLFLLVFWNKERQHSVAIAAEATLTQGPNKGA